MRVAHPLMRNEVHTRGLAILFAAVLIAVLLPVTVLFSREDVSPEARTHAELAVPLSRPRVAPVFVDWGADAAQSASMVLVGTLLIGIGSIVRRGVNL